jgi:hypothetical protein
MTIQKKLVETVVLAVAAVAQDQTIAAELEFLGKVITAEHLFNIGVVAAAALGKRVKTASLAQPQTLGTAAMGFHLQ